MFLVGALVLAGAVAGAWVGLIQPMVASFNQPKDYPGPGTGTVEVRIPDGASGTAIGQVLAERGVVLTVKGFVTAFTRPRVLDPPGSYSPS
jgi:UPF0755 protein